MGNAWRGFGVPRNGRVRGCLVRQGWSRLAGTMILARTIAVLMVMPLAACAAAVPGYSPTPSKMKVEADTSGTYSGGIYTLSADEKALDCRKLSGRMQIRILQIRDRSGGYGATWASRGMQTATGAVLGGTAYGTNVDAQRARDLAMLEAYNAELKAKNCPVFDLAEELKPKPVDATPRPAAKP